MARRVVLAILLALAVAAPALGDVHDRKQSVDAQIEQLQGKIAAATERETALAAEISAVTLEIRALETEVGAVSSRLEVLEHDLALHRERLDRLTELFRLQTARLRFLQGQYSIALRRLNQRLVSIYESDEIGSLDVVLSASSWTELLEQVDYFRQIGSQDKRIAGDVSNAKVQVQAHRARTRKTKAVVAAATRTIAVRTAHVRRVRGELLARQSTLATTRGRHRDSIASVRDAKKEYLAETGALLAVSAQLAAQIRSVQVPSRASSSSPSSSAPPLPPPDFESSSGFIWPVSGPVTSGFGWRWGRMHEGIDIGAGYGTPIRASASGVVIYAGWMGGYGNLIVIDHGGGLSTAYAHQSSFATGGGTVAQGQVVGYVGCTGHCLGPHLHFEVRVNGSAVDPLGYL